MRVEWLRRYRTGSWKVPVMASVLLLSIIVPMMYFRNTVHVVVLGMWPHDLTSALYRSVTLSVTWMESPGRMDTGYISRYDIIIMHDIPAAFLPVDFESNLIDGIAGGKGLLLFGGRFSLGSGGYHDSRLSGILPFTCASNDFRDQKAALNKTQDHDILKGVEVGTLHVEGYNSLAQRLDSSVVAVDYYTKLPMIVLGEYGRGRIAVLSFGTILEGRLAFDEILFNLIEWLAPASSFKAEVGLITIQIALVVGIMTVSLHCLRRRLSR